MAIPPNIINPISDVTAVSNAEDTILNLFNYFDDPTTTGRIARFDLRNPSLGNGQINVLLFDQTGVGAPLTVENFINYVDDGDYINTIIHRSVPGFVIQGGGFTVNQLTPVAIPTDPPVQNEFNVNRSNLRGTIAMAKQGNNPNSATNQWFFNLANNSGSPNNLDTQNGGFTVFGQVLSDADLTTIDAIATVPTFNFGGAFTNLPLQGQTNTSNPIIDNSDDFVRFGNISVFQANELQFTVIANSNPNLANVTIDGQTLRLDYLPRQAGTTQITIRATTLLGLGVEDTFTLTVFDPAQYGASHLDLILAYGGNLEALRQHYLNFGASEGRALDTFDEKAYLASYDDLLNAFGTDLQATTEHYLNYGAREGRSVNLFNPIQYLASYDDLIRAFGNNPEAAKDHFIQLGRFEGRSRDTFKEDIYLASYGDLIDAFGYNLEAATQHYINNGVSEGRAKERFDPVAYLNKYSDLQAAFGSDLVAATRHYIDFGYNEGRSWL